MLAAAAASAVPGRVEFTPGDVRDWAPDGPVDVVVSNAVLHWVPGHERLLARWAGWLRPGGWLAVQVPGNFRAPTHALLADLCRSPRWASRLADAAPRPGRRPGARRLLRRPGRRRPVPRRVGDDLPARAHRPRSGARLGPEHRPAAGARPARRRRGRGVHRRVRRRAPGRLPRPARRHDAAAVPPGVRRRSRPTEGFRVLTGLHHVQVACPAGSEDALRAFYGGVLGMTELAKPPRWPPGAGPGSGPAARRSTAGSRPTSGRPARRTRACSPRPRRAGRRCEAAGHPVQWDPDFPGHRRST